MVRKKGGLAVFFKENLNTQAVSFASNLSELLNVKTKKTKKYILIFYWQSTPHPP